MLDFNMLVELGMNKNEVEKLLEKVGYEVVESEDTIYNKYELVILCGHSNDDELNEFLFINNNKVVNYLQF